MPLTGQFEVATNSETGGEFTNTQSGEVSYTFSASGTWAPDKDNPNLQACTAEGFPSLHPYVQAGLKLYWPTMEANMKYPQKTPFALVAQNKNTGEVTEVGKKTTIVLKPGEILSFALNDAASWGYGNNSGSITVDWSGVSLAPKVMQFDGSNNSINFGQKPAFKISKDITIEAWICASRQRQWAGIASNIYDTSSTESGYGLLLDGSSGVYWGLTVQGNSIIYLSSGADTVTLNKWHHIAGTYDGETMRVYVDGVEKSQQAVAGTNLDYDPANDLLIGAYKDNNEAHYFPGKIAEVRLWNKARTQSEIQADMSKQLTGKEPGLVSYWQLNEAIAEGSTLKVSDLNNNFHGTVTGATLVEDSAFPVS